MEADYKEYQALFAIAPVQADSLLHGLEQTARGIGTQIKQSPCVIKMVLSPH